MTIIGLIRHGSTEWNVLGKLQGQLDTELNDAGREQARKLGQRLKPESWDGIISSDLFRAKETAHIISALSGIPMIRTDMRLRERSFGLAEGLTVQQRIERWGEQWKPESWGGESDAALWNRWEQFAEELKRGEFLNRRLLIVSHGSYIVQVLRGLGLEQEQYLENTSLTILEQDERSAQGWNLLLYNCLSHLH